MTYDIATQTIDTSALSQNDIINCSYSGAVKSITLPAGKYKLECTGADGGNGSYTNGGKGGSSTGTITFTEPTLIYLRTGGQGTSSSSSSAAGGFNGGGQGYGYSSSYRSGGGGGASDIRIGQDSLYARVIVAGGGGSGASRYSQAAGNGGGTSGGSSYYSSSYYGNGGTQTAGGTGISGTGSFGSGASSTSSYSTGGGGGWYGGGCGRRSGGGGGSGYVYNESTATNYPSGCLLNENYYLTESSTTLGSGTGSQANGTIKITILELNKMSIFLGNRKIKKIYLGNKEIKGLYLGNKKIF